METEGCDICERRISAFVWRIWELKWSKNAWWSCQDSDQIRRERRSWVHKLFTDQKRNFWNVPDTRPEEYRRCRCLRYLTRYIVTLAQHGQIWLETVCHAEISRPRRQLVWRVEPHRDVADKTTKHAHYIAIRDFGFHAKQWSSQT